MACCGEVGQDGVEFRFVEDLVAFAVEPCEAYGGLGVETPAAEARLGGVDEGKGDDGVGGGEVPVSVFQVHGTEVFEVEFIGDEVGFGGRGRFAREGVRIAGRLHVAGIDGAVDAGIGGVDGAVVCVVAVVGVVRPGRFGKSLEGDRHEGEREEESGLHALSVWHGACSV